MAKQENLVTPERRHEGSRFNNATPGAGGTSSRKTTKGARQVVGAFSEHRNPDHKITAKYPVSKGGK
jgi:hypothetical protein